MSQFERIKRYLTYSDRNCKKYLRKDFQRQCAYCLTREADLGSPDNFQIDHFVPQKGGHIGCVHPKYAGNDFNVHEYYNLYYSCSRCNGKGGKSDKWSDTLLDPCVDDIWGNHVQINDQGVVEYLTERGEEYIKTFNLNSKGARELRKKISKLNDERKKHLAILEKYIEENTGNPKLFELLVGERECDLNLLKYGAKYNIHDYYYDDEAILEVENILKKYNYSVLNGDYDLDYSAEVTGTPYYICLIIEDEIEFISGSKEYYLNMSRIIDWKDKNILICHYDRVGRHLYYYELEQNIIKQQNEGKTRMRYLLQESNVLI